MTVCKNRFILIRGLLRESRHWGDFPTQLQRNFPSTEILTPDIPGNGRLYQQPSPNHIGGMTSALRAQIRSGKPAHIIGLSMGGMIAVDWMIRFPEDIQSAVLINTSLRQFSPFYHRLRWQIYPTIFKIMLQSPASREQTILAMTSNQHQRDQELLERWQKWQQQYPISSANIINQLLAATRFSAKIKPRQPLLVAASKSDRLVHYECSNRLQQQWNTDYCCHETAGHDIPLDDPGWLLEKIQRWLAKTSLL